ncbi:hypothetical protein PR003_g4029 [Phytophthora rubi]|uniref:Uncharacterized protein n=1 Tax=Phytophthora rubi TaxID=129364 RepID=A0A6A3LKB4_9STRA|nr:hypothetical protein PR002_g15091 [Phytophthora rubi]KAE9016293.1 hypothetical protein PR001_g14696 [Phytophthora rubi]KAE9353119.1 hypothetical protein PR003_g4029 [Phytophthora rubi]
MWESVQGSPDQVPDVTNEPIAAATRQPSSLAQADSAIHEAATAVVCSTGASSTVNQPTDVSEAPRARHALGQGPTTYPRSKHRVGESQSSAIGVATAATASGSSDALQGGGMDPGAAPGKRKRGRPKGSKNKPKNATTAAGQPKRTQGIRVDSTTNRSGKTRRCLDTAMTQDAMATDTLPPRMVETDTISAAVTSAREHDAPFAAPNRASATAATPSPNSTAS